MFQEKVFFSLISLLCIHSISCAVKEPSVIIIGAGASGIAAATKLLKNNITNFKILEAEDRIGGRINSVHFGDAFIDLGAEFCHGKKNNIVYDMVKDLNVLRRSKKGNIFFFQSSGAEINSRLSDKIFDLVDDLTEGKGACDNYKSIGACLDAKFEQLFNRTELEKDKNILKDAKIWMENAVLSYESSMDINDLAVDSLFEDSEGDKHLNWNGLGYKTMLDILMQKFPPTATPLSVDSKILLNKEITKISKWDEDGELEITCKDGTVYNADLALFSPSLGVLKSDYKTLFEPSLPQEKIDAIENIGFGAIAKIFMEFPEDTSLDYVMTTVFRENEFDIKKHLSWLKALTALVRAPNNPRVVVGWYSGKEVPRIESLTEEQVMEGQKYIVEYFLLSEFKHFNITEPTQIKRSKWYFNPHFRGTYSYESVQGANKDKNWFKDMAKPLKNKNNKSRVLFMGEATNSKHYATVHGAIESGYREAENIIKHYRK